MRLQAGWQVVAILYIEIVFVSMGIFFVSHPYIYMHTLYGQDIMSSCISYQRVQYTWHLCRVFIKTIIICHISRTKIQLVGLKLILLALFEQVE